MLLKTEEHFNPLDIAEMAIIDRDWAFDRVGAGELMANVKGVWGNYCVWFSWQEDSGGLTLCCSIESKFPKAMAAKLYALLALVNEKLWLGHFDISSEESTVVFRHSLLLREGVGTTCEHLQDLLDIAVEECERFYPAYQSVVWGGKSPEEALTLALFETIAEA